MKPRDLLLALAVVVAWGVNFVVIEVGLEDFPPLLFSALRFFFAAIPAIFILGRPRVAWRYVIGVGLALGVAKFGLLFIAMDRGVPAGLSAVRIVGPDTATGLVRITAKDAVAAIIATEIC